MTKQEFEQRTGIEVSNDYFEEIHKIYMEAGDYVNKDTFCKEWMNENQTIKGMHNTIREMGKKLEYVTAKLQENEHFKSDLVNFLLKRAQAFSDEELLNKAIELVGHADVIRRKLAADLNLWDRDREYIKNNLG